MRKSSLSLGVCVLMADNAPETRVTVMNVHFDVYFTVFVGARDMSERDGERESCASDWIGGSAEEAQTQREREREREGTNAVYTLAQLPEITASPILPDWNRGGRETRRWQGRRKWREPTIAFSWEMICGE